MKPRFELWDSNSANLLGTYESVPDVLADLDKAFPTPESKMQINDLVLTLELDGEDDDAMVLLNGSELFYRLVRPLPASGVMAS